MVTKVGGQGVGKGGGGGGVFAFPGTGSRGELGDISTARSCIPAVCLHHARARAGWGGKGVGAKPGKDGASPCPPPLFEDPKGAPMGVPILDTPPPIPLPSAMFSAAVSSLGWSLGCAGKSAAVIQRAERRRRSGGTAGPSPSPGWHRWVPLTGCRGVPTAGAGARCCAGGCGAENTT